MEFRISDTFTDSLARLTGQEQKAVKTTAFDLQIDPSNPGMQFHKLSKAKDSNFWSVRVSDDIRLIVHKTSGSLLLCYVDHHDKAYEWAERRKLETHPKTGAAQLVEIRERTKEITIPIYVQEEQGEPSKPPLFTDIPEGELLGYGVPPEWIEDVRRANEDTLLDLADHLPAEAAEALLNLAVGAKPEITPETTTDVDPFAHPDAQRRFRVLSNVKELERALEYPWEKWAIFLHPAQQKVVERGYGGPARVSGSAGTGKTVVALHRAVHLARQNSDARVLLTTFSDTLANALRIKFNRLITSQPRLGERVDVYAMNTLGHRLYELNFGKCQIARREVVCKLIDQASEEIGDHKFSKHFLVTEWEQVVDAWQLGTWEEYRDVQRLGRKTRLPESRRATLWEIYKGVRKELSDQNLLTYPTMYRQLEHHYENSDRKPYDFIVVDEAQDVTIPQLRFLAAMHGNESNSLFFAGDLGQRIFQQPFSWLSLGVDIRGRSQTLKINYRTSHQIRTHADRLLAPDISDVDGNIESRRGTVSVFNGPNPEIEIVDDERRETELVATWLSSLIDGGVQPQEIAIFVRSPNQFGRAKRAVEGSQADHKILDDNLEAEIGHVSISTMHLAKGLEFKAVAVMACDDEILPLQERIETVSDDSDLEEVYNTERHLLYVAATRARDHLLVTGVEPGSEFLEDLRE